MKHLIDGGTNCSGQAVARRLSASLLFALVMIGLAACGRAEPAEIETSAPGIAESAQTTEAPQAIEPWPIPELATASEPSPTAEPSSTPPASPTAEPSSTPGPSPTPTLSAPEPIGTIEQPAYAESECSDKYPCNDDVEGWEARLRLPEGFTGRYFARVEGQPNVITFGPDGLLYAATMDGAIYRINEEGNVSSYVDGFLVPTGMAFLPGTEKLYVSSRVEDLNVGGEAQISVVEDGEIEQLIGGLPCCYTSFHSANGIAFGPDGYGYVSVGARADHGEILVGDRIGEQDERDELEASILRFSPDGRELEPYARGFRNAYDIAWDADGRLFTTDNMPDYGPPEEFNLVEPGGEHGYPWYDCEGCFSPPDDLAIVPPLHTFPAHTSPTGITAYLADRFPGYYNSLFVTLWSAFPGAQKIVWFSKGGEEMADFATGFAAPIDVTVGPDGNLYVADWATGIIFQISYTG